MAEADNIEAEVGKQRSPAYPYISLDLALERAKIIFENIRDTAQPREVLAKAYGKSVTSSATIQTFATLIQYGLLETVWQSGQRRLKISTQVRTLLNPNAPGNIVRSLKKEAALKPVIFNEIWEKFGTTLELHDGAVLYYLTHDRGVEKGASFTERAAQEVLRVYRASVVFAGLEDSDKIAEDGEDEADSEKLQPVLPELQAPPAGRQNAPAVEQIPPSNQPRRLGMAEQERELQTGMLSKTASYRVIVSGKVGVKEIERLIKKLEMDKEILADDDHDEDPRHPDDLRDAAYDRLGR